MHISSSRSSCPACKQAEHSLYICPVFKSLSLDRKKTVTKKVKACFNCLSIGHLSGSCPSRKSCRQCGRRHHTLLHSEMNSPSPTTNRQSESAPAASTMTNQPPSILQVTTQVKEPLSETAMMTISAGERSTVGRAMFDSGARMSIVTSRLANILKARRISRPTQITGLASSFNSKYVVQLTLSSTHNSGGETRDVLLHVIEEEIPVQTPHLESIRQLPFLHNNSLLTGVIVKLWTSYLVLM